MSVSPSDKFFSEGLGADWRIARNVNLVLPLGLLLGSNGTGAADLPNSIDDVAEVVAAGIFGDLSSAVDDVAEVVTTTILGIHNVVSHCSEKK